MPSTITSRIDGLTTSVAVKPPIKIMATAALTLSGEQTINSTYPDGSVVTETVLDGDRVGVNGQADKKLNGIYVCRTTAWERAKDFDGSLDAVYGTLVTDSVPVIWRLITPIPVLFGTSNIEFETEDGFNQNNFEELAAQGGAGLVGYSELEAYPNNTVGSELQDLGKRYATYHGAKADGVTDDTSKINEGIASVGRIYSDYGTLATTFLSTPAGLAGDGRIKLTSPSRIEWINPVSRVAWKRVSPSGFSYVPNFGITCAAPGEAKHNIDLAKVFEANHSSLFGNSEYWVDPVNGLDTNTGSVFAPFKTVKKAYQAASAGTIRLKEGAYTDSFFLEFSDNTVSAGTLARPIRIIGLGDVTIRAPGQQPSAMTWTLDATFGSSIYSATPSGSETANAILWTHKGLSQLIPFKSAGADLASVSLGWFQDSGTKKIHVKLGGFNVETDKANLEIMYSRGTNSGTRGTTTYIENVNFRGDTLFLASYDASSHRSTVYFKNCSFKYMQGANFQSYGAKCYFQNVTSSYALNGDGFNYYDEGGPGVPGGQYSEIVEIDCIAKNNATPIYNLEAGDPSSPSRLWDGVRNKQGSSGHDSSVICRINGVYEGNFGQNIADTGSTSKTWMIGSDCRDIYAELAVGGTQGRYIGLWTEGAAYFDTVRSSGETLSYGFYNQSGTSKHFNCTYRGFTANMALIAGSISALNPADPAS